MAWSPFATFADGNFHGLFLLTEHRLQRMLEEISTDDVILCQHCTVSSMKDKVNCVSTLFDCL